jgi:SAM-dependent methyltransferase
MSKFLFPLVALMATLLPSATVLRASDDDDGSSGRTPDVVYVGSPNDVVAKMLEVADVKKEDVLYDLGCGDGRIVVMAAKKYGCRAYGYDINPVRIRESLENIKRNAVEDLATVERRDVFTIDLTPANVITLYLLPEMNARLIPQLQQLKPGSRIVAHDYGIRGVTPDKSITMDSKVDGVPHYIYLYTAPLKMKKKAEAGEDDAAEPDES